MTELILLLFSGTNAGLRRFRKILISFHSFPFFFFFFGHSPILFKLLMKALEYCWMILGGYDLDIRTFSSHE